MSEAIYFNTDSARIRPEFEAVIDAYAEELSDPRALEAIVVGRADLGETHPRQLALDRALAMGRALEERGVSTTKLQIVSSGTSAEWGGDDGLRGVAAQRVRVVVSVEGPEHWYQSPTELVVWREGKLIEVKPKEQPRQPSGAPTCPPE